jgi:hypothetical protein
MQREIVDSSYSLSELYYADAGYKVEFFSKVLFVAGDVKTYMLKRLNDWEFQPVYTDFGFSAGLQFAGMEMGISHKCTHPQNLMEGILSPMQAEQSSATEIYFMFSTKTDGHF